MVQSKWFQCGSAEWIAGFLLVALIAASSPAETPVAEHFSHVTIKAPQGWNRSENGGWVLYTPADLPAGQTVWIGLSPGGKSNRDLAEEFAALVKASANGLTTMQEGEAKSLTDRQGLTRQR